jgi:hypothetical protein
MDITYGNREGQYFTEWRFDILKDLLNLIHTGPCPPHTETVELAEVKIWYDAREDFHRLSFQARGHLVEVQLYKVLSSKIDGKEHWTGCPRSNMYEYANSIRRELGIQPRPA